MIDSSLWQYDRRKGHVGLTIIVPTEDVKVLEEIAHETNCWLVYQYMPTAEETEILLFTTLPHRFNIEFAHLLYKKTKETNRKRSKRVGEEKDTHTPPTI